MAQSGSNPKGEGREGGGRNSAAERGSQQLPFTPASPGETVPF